MTLHKFLCVVQSFVDAAQELAARRFGQFRFVDELLGFAQRGQCTFRIFLAQADSFGLTLENFRVELAEDDLLSFIGRVDQRFTLSMFVAGSGWAGGAGSSVATGGAGATGTATGVSCFGKSLASEMTAALPDVGQRQVIGRRRCEFGTNRSFA